MTPKEKAEELVEKFKFETKRSEIVNDLLLGDISVVFKHYKAKQCALIAVDEIIKSKELNYLFTKDQINCMESTSDDRWIYEKFMKYWFAVKKEIKKL
jgi:hypothetical protein